MRSTIFVSLVLASGVASFGASACDTRDVYNQKIYNLLEKYQSEIIKDNDEPSPALPSTWPLTKRGASRSPQ
jgi:secreted trypsin-like serine protease